MCAEAGGIELPPGGKGLPAEPFASFPYEKECIAKERALIRFLADRKIPGECLPLVRSPLSRGYRTTTKRKLIFQHGGAVLASDAGRTPVINSLLEPEGHRNIYKDMTNWFRSEKGEHLADIVSMVVLRGSYDEFHAVIKCSRMDAKIIKSLHEMGDFVRETNKKLFSMHAFKGDPDSPYYLDGDAFAGGKGFRKVFGPDEIRHTIGGVNFRFPILSFSQVNPGIAELIAQGIRQEFSPRGNERLIDCYSGYGLFSALCGKGYSEVVGGDINQTAVGSAIQNIHSIKGFPPARFTACRIDAKTLNRLAPKREGIDHLILDPPRNGTAPGVIGYFARNEVRRVVHLVCGVDELPREVAEWRKNSYWVEQIVPYDMFPGTLSLELAVYFTRYRGESRDSGAPVPRVVRKGFDKRIRRKK